MHHIGILHFSFVLKSISTNFLTFLQALDYGSVLILLASCGLKNNILDNTWWAVSVVIFSNNTFKKVSRVYYWIYSIFSFLLALFLIWNHTSDFNIPIGSSGPIYDYPCLAHSSVFSVHNGIFRPVSISLMKFLLPQVLPGYLCKFWFANFAEAQIIIIIV